MAQGSPVDRKHHVRSRGQHRTIVGRFGYMDAQSPTGNPGTTRRSPARVGGEDVWSSETIDVRSPYDDSLLSVVPECSTAIIDDAVAVAHDRLDHTKTIPAYERAEILDRAATVLAERSEMFAKSISTEAAKPITAARTEVTRAIDTIRFSAAAARSLTGEMIPMDASRGGSGRLGFTLREPIGVIGCITPFNFPLNLVCHKVAPGIAAGAPMVLKPASATPLTALLLAELFEDCGLPPGWLNVVTCRGATASHLVTHPDVAMITFTGSAEVGWALRASAPRKKVSLELGNSSPVIVTADADVELAAQRIVAGGFGYSGQTCISVQRVYAHHQIHDALIARVAVLTGHVTVGAPDDDTTVVTSLIDDDAAIRVSAWIDEAVSSGAELVSGTSDGADTTTLLPRNTVRPTILSGIDETMDVSCNEVFGPVIGFRGYGTLDEAIDLANGTRYGLQAGIFTRDLATAIEASRRLEFGGVIVNDTSSYRTDQMPYGGTKDSGNTREGPAHAIEEMTVGRTVIIRG